MLGQWALSLYTTASHTCVVCFTILCCIWEMIEGNRKERERERKGLYSSHFQLFATINLAIAHTYSVTVLDFYSIHGPNYTHCVLFMFILMLILMLVLIHNRIRTVFMIMNVWQCFGVALPRVHTLTYTSSHSPTNRKH